MSGSGPEQLHLGCIHPQALSVHIRKRGLRLLCRVRLINSICLQTYVYPDNPVCRGKTHNTTLAKKIVQWVKMFQLLLEQLNPFDLAKLEGDKTDVPRGTRVQRILRLQRS